MYFDLITKIKNASNADKRVLKVRFSHMDKSIADILERIGFVSGVEVKGRPSKRFIFISLKSSRLIQGTKFYSKPSVRHYLGYREIKKVKGGHGFLFLSTPKGILIGDEARRAKVGGEVLFEIW